MNLPKIDGFEVTEQGLAASAPALLALYNGWWRPPNKMPLDEITQAYEALARRGVKIFAK